MPCFVRRFINAHCLEVAEFKNIGGQRTLVAKKQGALSGGRWMAMPSWSLGSACGSLSQQENTPVGRTGTCSLWCWSLITYRQSDDLSLLASLRQMGHTGSLPSLSGQGRPRDGFGRIGRNGKNRENQRVQPHDIVLCCICFSLFFLPEIKFTVIITFFQFFLDVLCLHVSH